MRVGPRGLVAIHPLALFRIADAYTCALKKRRESVEAVTRSREADSDTTVQGILLGTKRVQSYGSRLTPSRSCLPEEGAEWEVMFALECAPLTPHNIERVYETACLVHPNTALLGWYTAKSPPVAGAAATSDAQLLSIEAAIIHQFQQEALWLQIRMEPPPSANFRDVVPQMQAWLVTPRMQHQDCKVPVTDVMDAHLKRGWDDLLASLSVCALSLTVEESEAERWVMETLRHKPMRSELIRSETSVWTSRDEHHDTSSHEDAFAKPRKEASTETTHPARDLMSSGGGSSHERSETAWLARRPDSEATMVRYGLSAVTRDDTDGSSPNCMTQVDALRTAMALALRSVRDTASCERLQAQLCSLEQATRMLLERVRTIRAIFDAIEFRFGSCPSAEDLVYLPEAEASVWGELQRCLARIPFDEYTDSAPDVCAVSRFISEGMDVAVAMEGLCLDAAGLATLYERLAVHRSPMRFRRRVAPV